MAREVARDWEGRGDLGFPCNRGGKLGRREKKPQSSPSSLECPSVLHGPCTWQQDALCLQCIAEHTQADETALALAFLHPKPFGYLPYSQKV